MSSPVFERLPGLRRATLAPCVSRLHVGDTGRRYRGEVDVEHGRGILAALCRWVMRLPPAGRGAIEIRIDDEGEAERWTRRFGQRTMTSVLWVGNGLLHERIGAVTLQFVIRVEDGALAWRAVGARCLGVPLPGRAFAQVGAREHEESGRYHFDVHATLPIVGFLLRYRGWLDVE
ncbi:MAG: DUF4166 domain-containing protein [Dokdonella sp.]|uniref:DUF4166 domain-containing protein n=1 Tax=Dokdonella sp. TaxID=2291710 RepID=UPI003265B6C7